MKGIREFYNYLKGINELVNELVSDETSFYNDSNRILSGLDIYLGVYNNISSLSDLVIGRYSNLLELKKRMELLKEYVINSYGLINVYLVYDFLKLEYKNLYDYMMDNYNK